MSGAGGLKPGEALERSPQEHGLYDLMFVAIAPSLFPSSSPGYGSTTKMISECAIASRDSPLVSLRLQSEPVRIVVRQLLFFPFFF